MNELCLAACLVFGLGAEYTIPGDNGFDSFADGYQIEASIGWKAGYIAARVGEEGRFGKLGQDLADIRRMSLSFGLKHKGFFAEIGKGFDSVDVNPIVQLETVNEQFRLRHKCESWQSFCQFKNSANGGQARFPITKYDLDPGILLRVGYEAMITEHIAFAGSYEHQRYEENFEGRTNHPDGQYWVESNDITRKSIQASLKYYF